MRWTRNGIINTAQPFYSLINMDVDWKRKIPIFSTNTTVELSFFSTRFPFNIYHSSLLSVDPSIYFAMNVTILGYLPTSVGNKPC